ncbi:MAG: YihA family ribosome biogenesis GTP-binding protein [Clostridia bacterium]|nr:YihA family ribosome biogenesis GTP-binding protein [Oscillospiraceae bacterium]MBQ7960752.1 YihA family ribosome biogenesis GTP-binding protein [Clostridia bacterium]
MEFIDIKLLKTAVKPDQYPDETLPEIALVGRSNVGKSSLINCLANRKNIARTSSTPGKTATINFYEISGKYRIVDLPGYGYAKVSKQEKEKWGEMIEGYLSSRSNLVQVVQLVDARHKPTADDKMMFEWIRSYNYEPLVVATKLDKLKKSQIEGNLTAIYEELELSEDSVLIPFSSETRQGRDEVIELVEYILDSDKGKSE